jgi:hypothetical protein
MADTDNTKSDGQDSAAQDSDPRMTHFNFQGKVFKAPGAMFILRDESMGRMKVCRFACDMGGGIGDISLKALRKTFEIAPGSHDDVLITRAEAGLQYVPDIRPGDAIPSELLNGTASWTVSRKHKQIARDRIQGQLLAWMTGKDVDASDREGLKKLMESPETKKTLRDAFQKAAVAIGLPPTETEQVVDRIETLAREFCYIEALRDRCEQIQLIRKRLEILNKAYSGDKRIVGDISRIKALLIDGLREVFTPLAMTDAKSADIVGMLQNIDRAIADIRKARDSIHFILMEWDSILAQWEKLAPERSVPVEKAMSALYKFLALRFQTGKSILSKGGGF